MAAIKFWRLEAQAIDIRDTQTQYNNTTELVGGWMTDVIDYQDNTAGPGYARLKQLSGLVTAETATEANTAQRLGEWCELAVGFAWQRLTKPQMATRLTRRARQIRRETEDQRNERRLGAWFRDYLTYIDYAGDVDIEKWFCFVIRATAGQEVAIGAHAAGATQEPITFLIDWGDGIQEDQTIVYRQGRLTHTFAQSGDYTVYFHASGDLPAAIDYRGTNLVTSGRPTAADRQALIKVLAVDRQSPATQYNFYECTNLSITSAADWEVFRPAFAAATSVSGFMEGCTGVTANIPIGLIAARQQCSYDRAFVRTNITTVLSDTFKLTRAGNLSEIFSYCPLLTEVQDRALRTDWTEAVNTVAAYQAFAYCPLLARAGADVFPAYTSSLQGVFTGSIVLSVVSPYVFRGITASSVTMYGAFQGCRGITTPDAEWFRSLGTEKITIINYLFSGAGLTSFGPVDLFRGFTRVNSAMNVFAYCSSAVGPPPSLEYLTAVTTTNYMYSACLGLTELPAGYMDPLGTRLTQATGMYSNSGLTAVRGDLLRQNTRLTNINSLISGTQITELPADLCQGLTELTNVGELVRSTLIKVFPAEVFRDCAKISIFTALCRSCGQLTEVADDVFTYSSSTARYTDQAFQDCPALLRVPSTLLRGCDYLRYVSSMFQDSGVAGVDDDFFVDCVSITAMISTFRGLNPSGAPWDISGLQLPVGVTDFTYTFYEANVSGTSPTWPDGAKLWERAGQPGYPARVTGPGCFRNASALSDYAQIPTAWK